MATVRQLLDMKSIQVLYTISPEETTYEALKVMAKHDIGAVAVVENDRLVGLITERDYARRIVLEGKKSRNTPVRDTMTSPLLVIDPDKTVEDCMALMTEKHMRYLPVLEGDAFIGIVSIGDVVKCLLADQKRDIEHLVRYISGAEYATGRS